MTRLIAGVVFMLLVSTPVHASMTVAQFLEGQKLAASEDDFTNSVYVWGVADALKVFNDVIRNNIGQNLFCVGKDSREITVPELVVEIEEEIEFSRKRVVDFEAYANQTTVSEVAIIVLSRAYNCAAKS